MTHCPFCALDYPTATDALLCRIGDLVQQLVDTDTPKAADVSATAAYVCGVCGFRCQSEASFQAHEYRPSHLDAVAKAAAMR